MGRPHCCTPTLWCTLRCTGAVVPLGATALCLVLRATGIKYVLDVIPFFLAMWRWPDVPEIQIASCDRVQDHGWNEPHSKDALMWLGSHVLAIRAMRRFPQNRNVQLACAGALGSVSLYNARTSLAAGERGAVELVADAVRRFKHDPEMVMGGIFGCFNDFSPINRARMREAGGITLLLEACGIGGPHYWNAKTQFQCWCGFSSFHIPENHEAFAREGGMEAAVQIMRDHAKSYRVREEVLQALKGVSRHSEGFRAALAGHGLLGTLLATLREDAGDPQVTCLGLELLRTMTATNATSRTKVLESGATDIVFDALKQHSGKLKDTRTASWDSQNVYGDLNDHQYNVPGAATEMLLTLANHSRAVQEGLLKAGVVALLAHVLEATRGRVVQGRAHFGACLTLRELLGAVAGSPEHPQVLDLIQHYGCDWFFARS